MPAQSPRIAVYLPKPTYVSVKRLAALRGVSMSAVVREFLIETTPVLDRIAGLLDLAARADKTALKAWAKDLEAAQGDLERNALDSMTRLDQAQHELALLKPGRPVAGAERTRRRKPAPGRRPNPRNRHD